MTERLQRDRDHLARGLVVVDHEDVEGLGGEAARLFHRRTRVRWVLLDAGHLSLPGVVHSGKGLHLPCPRPGVAVVLEGRAKAVFSQVPLLRRGSPNVALSQRPGNLLRASAMRPLERRRSPWHPLRMSLRRESRRMSRVFGALVLALGPAAAAQACSDAAISAGTPIEDASAENDSTLPDTSAADGADDDVTDAAASPIDAVCTLTETMRDADPDAPDADPGCHYVLPCGAPANAPFHVEGCALYTGSDPDSALGCWVPENAGCTADVYVPPANGSLTFDCFDCFGGGGRRPPGLLSELRERSGRTRATASARTRGPAAYFARMAYDEAASVHAFLGLEADLVRIGAPPELVAAAARSARDEIRHARVMARRARSSGGDVVAPRVRRRRAAARSLESIARENAVEGCVHETFGALQLRWQASHAPEPSMRRLFGRIAADETRHAALSWMIARWIEPRLDPRARKRVEAARSRATRTLRTKLSTTAPRDFDMHVGRPGSREAVMLFDSLLARV
jgi:hypothetical protein